MVSTRWLAPQERTSPTEYVTSRARGAQAMFSACEVSQHNLLHHSPELLSQQISGCSYSGNEMVRGSWYLFDTYIPTVLLVIQDSRQ